MSSSTYQHKNLETRQTPIKNGLGGLKTPLSLYVPGTKLNKTHAAHAWPPKPPVRCTACVKRPLGLFPPLVLFRPAPPPHPIFRSVLTPNTVARPRIKLPGMVTTAPSFARQLCIGAAFVPVLQLTTKSRGGDRIWGRRRPPTLDPSPFSLWGPDMDLT